MDLLLKTILLLEQNNITMCSMSLYAPGTFTGHYEISDPLTLDRPSM
jgi:hypothetical protein